MRLKILLGAVCLALAAACVWVVPAQAGRVDKRLSEGASAAAHRDVNCSDFPNQAAAQSYFLSQGGPALDPDGLDSDHDGIACESLPCPCSSGSPPTTAPPTTSTPSTTPTATGSASPTATPTPAPSGTPTGPPHGSFDQGSATVVRVLDGDTVQVQFGDGFKPIVRLLGINAPDVTTPARCWATQATTALSNLLPVGKIVDVLKDRTQANVDPYGRLLRYVVADYTDVSRRQVRSGNARVYLFDGEPFKYLTDYRKVQKQAKSHGRGLWGGC